MKLIKQLLVIAFVTIAIASCNQKDAVTPAANQGSDGILKTGPYCGDSYYDLLNAGGVKIATLNVFSSPNNVYIYVRGVASNTISNISGSIGGAAFNVNNDNMVFMSQGVNNLSCGNTYSITATAVINNETVSISVGQEYFLECCCWSEETAWAFGPRYNTRGNWATYVPYNGVAKTVDLMAGKNTKIGTVSFSAPLNSKVTITIDLGGRYSFADVSDNVKIQDYATAPSGNPAPGQFDHKFTGNYGDTGPFSVEVPQNSFYGVHVDALLSEVCEE